MRRSITVKLTLLPMLASAAVAAQPAMPDAEAQGPPPGIEPMISPPGTEPMLSPPGAEPMLSPPGLTPTIDECREDPCNPRCAPPAAGCEPSHGSWIFRGGFGHYFWHVGG